jgi:hypothetical protein
MLFHSKKKIDDNLYIKIDNKLIDRVAHTKFLGVYIDDKLNWKQHINFISGKVSRCIGMLIKSRKVLNKDSLLTLYFSFIYPLLIYCNHVWGSTYASTLYRLEILQKKVIRIIAGAKPRSSSEPIFAELGVLKLKEINKYLLLKFMHKFHLNSIPDALSNYFTNVHDIHKYNTRHSVGLYIPKVSTSLAKNSIKYRGPTIWNEVIKLNINVDISEATFSYKVKILIKDGAL